MTMDRYRHLKLLLNIKCIHIYKSGQCSFWCRSFCDIICVFFMMHDIMGLISSHLLPFPMNFWCPKISETTPRLSMTCMMSNYK